MRVFRLADGPPLYYISFIVVGGMIILNLFIGVIMNSMQESTADIETRRARKRGRKPLQD